MKKNRMFFFVLGLMISFVQCDSQYRKGPARFCESKNSKISKERNAFVSYYKAEPFEYQDSIFHMKLVFKEAFTEWIYWFDEKDNKYKRDTVIKSQQFIALYDTSQSLLGVIDTLFYTPPANPFPIKYWVINNPGHGAQSEGFYGFGFGPGRKNFSYGDTIVVPIVANTRYSDTTGKDYSNYSFGEIVFIRKLDTII